MSEYCRYVIIKNNELKILETKRMIKLIKKELGFFDYRDYLFEDNLSIYLLVSDLSIFGDDTSIIYRSYPGDCDSTFSGTVIFTKMNEHGYVSLNKDDIEYKKKFSLVKQNLDRNLTFKKLTSVIVKISHLKQTIG